MTDYRTMYDGEYLGAWDLVGRDVTVTISKVEAKKIKSERGEIKKPVLFFEGKEKAMVACKTNTKIIAAMYGQHVEKWVGKKITLYATTTPVGGESRDCIRIRPGVPKEGG